MKKITLLVAFLTAFYGFAQQQEYLFDFEPGNPDGVASNWLTFDNNPPSAEIIDNPDPGEVNPNVNKVLKVIVGPGNAFYAGVNNTFADAVFGTWEIDAAVPSNLTVSMDINKNYIGTVGIKMANTTGGTAFQITDQNVGNTVVDQWQTLTWTLPSIPPGLETNLSQFVIFVDWTEGQPDRAENSTIHIDNIKFNAEKLTDPPSGETVPTTAAPVPTPLQSQVINMYSNAYTTDVNVSSWKSDWSIGTYTNDVLVDGAGSETKRYFDADFVGVEFYGSDAVDATSMNYFHVDVWTPNATTFRVKLVDLDNGTVEGEIAFPNFTQGQWVSLDIPLDDFADPTKVTNPANLLTSRNSIQQLIFSGLPTGTFDFYIDNVYFSTVESLSVNEFDSVGYKVFPNPSEGNWTIKSNNLVTSIQLFDVLGKQVLSLNPNAPLVNIDGTDLSKGVYFAKITANTKISTVKLIKN